MPAVADGSASPAEIRMIDKKSFFREREVFTPEMREALDHFYSQVDNELFREEVKLVRKGVRRG